METLHFSIAIKAPAEKIWKILWNDVTYREWTSVFSEGSYAVSDWHEGSKVLFLNGEGNGMYSIVAKNVPNEQMWFKHIGVVRNGVEEQLDEETKKYSGARENYSLEEHFHYTTLSVDIDLNIKDIPYFKSTFPKALDRVKKMAEKKDKNPLLE